MRTFVFTVLLMLAASAHADETSQVAAMCAAAYHTTLSVKVSTPFETEHFTYMRDFWEQLATDEEIRTVYADLLNLFEEDRARLEPLLKDAIEACGELWQDLNPVNEETK
jgi:hypothetical protein